jgi:hypothetical protein
MPWQNVNFGMFRCFFYSLSHALSLMLWLCWPWRYVCWCGISYIDGRSSASLSRNLLFLVLYRPLAWHPVINAAFDLSSVTCCQGSLHDHVPRTHLWLCPLFIYKAKMLLQTVTLPQPTPKKWTKNSKENIAWFVIAVHSFCALETYNIYYKNEWLCINMNAPWRAIDNC